MPFGNYTQLQAAIASEVNRTDLTSSIVDFIALAEARIRRDQIWLEQTYSLVNGGQPLECGTNPITVPVNIVQVESMWASNDIYHHTIEVLPQSAFQDLVRSNNNAAGVPVKAVFVPLMNNFPGTLTGMNLYLWPAAAVGQDSSTFAVDFQYIGDVIPLATTPTNALLTRHPDLYFYGALAESAPFLMDDPRLPMWNERYEKTVTAINVERERARFSTSAKRPRLPRVF